MPLYTLYIKNHAIEGQDYEDNCSAGSKEEASNTFYKRFHWEAKEEWNPQALIRHIQREPDPDYSPEEALEARLPV